MSRVPDFFGPAQTIANDSAELVRTRISEASTTATQLRSSAEAALNALSQATFNVNEEPPAIPDLSSIAVTITNPSTASRLSFGAITSPGAGDPPVQGDYTMPDVSFDDFVPSISGLIIPEAPSAGVFTVPTKPSTAVITYPAAPAEVIPTLDGLVAISIPTFTFPTLPTWDGVLPAFEGNKPSNVFAWAEPTYAPTVLDDAVAAIQGIFSGGHGLPPAVEDAIFNRMSDREDAIVSRAVSEAMDEYSSRGFTNPPGMLTSRVDAIRQEGLMKKQGANRELTIKFAEWEIENYRLAIQQGIAAEGIYSNLWNNGVQRTFEAQKYQIEAAISIYNAAVGVFNAKMLGYQTQSSVYKTQIDAALAELDVYKAQLQGEKIKSEINQVQVQAYEARIRAVLGTVEIYKAKMEGSKIQADVARLAIESFKAEVDAYGAQVAADKNRFEAYKARIEGEGAKAQILESEARAFAAKIQGQAAQVQAYKTEAEVVIEKNKAAIQAFMAEVEKDKATMQYQLSGIQANVAGFQADVARFSAEAGLEEGKAKVNVAAYEATTRTEIAYYQAQAAAYAQRVEQMLREAALTIESMKTVASVSATLAAGAMAGVNASAQISGQGNVNAVGQLTGADTFSVSYQVQSEGSPPTVLP